MTDPFHEGYVAGREDRSVFANPYDLEDEPDRNCDWHDGFMEARHDMYTEQKRREYWADVRSSCWEGFINILWAVGFVTVCWAVGFGLRHWVATL